MSSLDPDENQEKEASSALNQAATTPELVEKTLDAARDASGAFMADSSGAMISVSPNAPEHLVGSIFDGKYEILSLLGQGGMSAVFKAKNLVLNRIVAIKILLGNRNLNEQSLMRFQQEARAASQLDHPNIVKVHDFSVSIEHAPYMVMDYVEGSSIAEIIAAEGKMDPYRAIDLIVQSCEALDHAHEQGVVHRDLKPSNIMVTQTKGGREIAKIVDFGVAKLLEEEQASAPQLTRTGEVFGSPLYMSPEQCLGKKVDARTDIYSLACVLFEELTGAPPFRSENVLATMHMHISDPPPELTKVRPDLPNGARLSSILLTALSKNPEQRFPSMQEFSTALNEAALKPQTGIGSLLTYLNIFRKTQGANRKLPILIVSTLSLLLIGITTYWGWQSMQEASSLKDRVFTDRDKEMAEFLRTADPYKLNIQNGRNLSDAIVPVMVKEPNLRTLYLRNAEISPDGFVELTKGLGKQLRDFSCTSNTHLMPKDLKRIVQNLDSDKIEHLSIQGCRATDDVVAEYARFKNLTNIEIGGTDITAAAFKNFPIIMSVHKIILNRTQANDETMRDIAAKFPHVSNLQLTRTQITDKGLNELKALPLTNINVVGCNVTTEGLRDLRTAIGGALVIVRVDKVLDAH